MPTRRRIQDNQRKKLKRVRSRQEAAAAAEALQATLPHKLSKVIAASQVEIATEVRDHGVTTPSSHSLPHLHAYPPLPSQLTWQAMPPPQSVPSSVTGDAEGRAARMPRGSEESSTSNTSNTSNTSDEVRKVLRTFVEDWEPNSRSHLRLSGTEGACGEHE